ncbi:hypothetical protein D6D54_07485 [Spiroplasma poulsonii]|uniref:Uncharacterized protein n=1 Tax=Spiroplasma poulsonii TaxID=2138 RepID=A0A3S0SK08_9MOLU|nr:hypothetical protein [Spiroplasma poulsonii]MBW3059324.1 hypothetical protein [Spiroplasma poulsonii]RUP74999.1 hypothetical protein D6D54_09110 [Spiroplasma poulsonii]RUP75874.1 hypothetical protein D6D54_07485 [Spiroplasma poulsonii]
MGKQEKILIMINRWGYLNTEQIGLLVNKKKRATEELLKTIHKKGLIKVDLPIAIFIISLIRVILLLVVNIKKQLR